MAYKPSKVEIERRNRIRLSVAAYSYEFVNDSIISDGEYDKLSLLIDTKVKTGHKTLDSFFRHYFDPSTGMWIRQHPDIAGLKRIYDTYFANRVKAKTNKRSIFED